MINWIHRLLNPHCKYCLEEKLDSLICKSCETLKQQLEIANFEKEKLLNRLLEKPIVEEAPVQNELKPIQPRTVPWHVRKQMLENESRESARLLRDKVEEIKQSSEPLTVEEIEKELGVVNES